MKIIAFVLIFLAASLALADEKLYIVLDNSKNSQLLKFELTRDWTSGKRLCSELYALDNKRTELENHLVIVDSSNPNERVKHEIPYLKSFPCYRFGKYKGFNEFPPQTFHNSSYPLLTTAVIYNNMTVDEIQWKQDCADLISSAKSQWRTNVTQWIYNDNFDEAQKLFSPMIAQTIDSPYESLALRHKRDITFPKYIPPVLPKCPVLKFPFEAQ